MLLFIKKTPDYKPPDHKVSIHLMLLFIVLMEQYLLSRMGFNTSHVTLYRQKKKLLLLRLIGFNTSHVTLYPCPDCCNRKSDQCFNTSHVTLYQEEREIREDKEEVSIHLMLLFIGYKIGNYCFFRLFQYISCYSLSQFLHTFEQINWKFQYISCYSLSSVCAFIFMLWIEFQYISCYSLSHYRTTL